MSQLSSKTRVVVLSGQGNVFSAGHNLKELTSTQGRDHHQCVFDACSELMLGLQQLEVPVIAQVRRGWIIDKTNQIHHDKLLMS